MHDLAIMRFVIAFHPICSRDLSTLQAADGGFRYCFLDQQSGFPDVTNSDGRVWTVVCYNV